MLSLKTVLLKIQAIKATIKGKNIKANPTLKSFKKLWLSPSPFICYGTVCEVKGLAKNLLNPFEMKRFFKADNVGFMFETVISPINDTCKTASI